MPDPRWSGPPEVIAATFETGCPASVIANNAAWTAETGCHETAMSLSAVNTAATATLWRGMGAVASTAAAFGLNAALQTLAGWIAEKIAITQAAVDAFTMASSSVIPSAVCQANRDEWATANATNFFGIRTPEIVALDTEYFGEHWPQNSSVGWAYSGALSALGAALAVPPPVAPMGASPAAPAAASEAVAPAAAQTGISDAMQVSNRVAQAVGQTASAPVDATSQVSSLTEPLQRGVSSAVHQLTALAQTPMQTLQGSASMPQALMQSVTGMFPTTADVASAESVAEPVVTGGGSTGGLGGGSPSATGGMGVYSGAGLTSYTRSASSFGPPISGQPAGLRADVLNAAGELRGLTTSPVTGGAAMPISSAAVPVRESGDSEKEPVNRARISVNSGVEEQ